MATPPDPIDDLIDISLDAAAQQHFIHLFDVLCAAETAADPEALERFERGLRKLVANYDAVTDLIAELKIELPH